MYTNKPTREQLPKKWRDKHHKAKGTKKHTPKEIYDRKKYKNFEDELDGISSLSEDSEIE